MSRNPIDDAINAPICYRGVTLPKGMTPSCLEDLSALLSDFEWDRLQKADGESVFAHDAAIMVFEIVSRHLAQKPQ